MFETPRRDKEARNFTTNVPKILDLKSFSEQISLGSPNILPVPYQMNSGCSKDEVNFNPGLKNMQLEPSTKHSYNNPDFFYLFVDFSMRTVR